MHEIHDNENEDEIEESALMGFNMTQNLSKA
jgi:hypothetical protein